MVKHLLKIWKVFNVCLTVLWTLGVIVLKECSDENFEHFLKKPIQEKLGISKTKYLEKNFFYSTVRIDAFCKNMNPRLYILFLVIIFGATIIPEQEGSSHHPAFMGIFPTFICQPYIPVHELFFWFLMQLNETGRLGEPKVLFLLLVLIRYNWKWR